MPGEVAERIRKLTDHAASVRLSTDISGIRKRPWKIWLTWSIWATGVAQMLHGSRILHANGACGVNGRGGMSIDGGAEYS
jgi:hypothetical protein